MFTKICDRHAPLRIRIVKDKRDKNPWLTKSIKKSITTKRKLYAKVISSNHESGAVSHYKSYRNILTSVLRKAKGHYYANLFNAKQDTNIWSTINDLLGKKRGPDKLPESLKVNVNCTEHILTDPPDIVHGFNNYFVNVGESLANNILHTNTDYRCYLDNSLSHSSFLQPVTAFEVRRLLETLNSKKASGWDNIPPKLLIDAAATISHP